MDKNETLELLTGQVVSVWTGESTDRNDFETAICCNGKLEKKSGHSDYRVVFNDGCYAYFKPQNVVEIVKHPNQFKDGAVAVIKIAMAKVPTIPEDVQVKQYYIKG